MREPITKLAIIPPSAIDQSIAAQLSSTLRSLSSLGGGNETPIIFFVGRIVKKTRHHFNEKRVLLVTLKHVLIYDEKGEQSRSIFVPDISRLIVCEDGFIVFKIPREHDLVARLEEVSYLEYLVNILKVLKQHFHLHTPLVQSGSGGSSPTKAANTAATDKLEVLASNLPFDKIGGPNKVNLSPNPSVSYRQNIQIPTILNVDASRHDIISSILSLPLPPARNAIKSLVVSSPSDVSRAERALQHPLFHPPVSIQSTSATAASQPLPSNKQPLVASPPPVQGSGNGATASKHPPSLTTMTNSMSPDTTQGRNRVDVMDQRGVSSPERSTNVSPKPSSSSAAVNVRSVLTIDGDMDDEASPSSPSPASGREFVNHTPSMFEGSFASPIRVSPPPASVPLSGSRFVSSSSPPPPPPLPRQSHVSPSYAPSSLVEMEQQPAAHSQKNKEPPSSSSAAATNTATVSFRDRVEAFYKLYDPSKLHLVDRTVLEFIGREEECLMLLSQLHGLMPTTTSSVAVTPALPPPVAASGPFYQQIKQTSSLSMSAQAQLPSRGNAFPSSSFTEGRRGMNGTGGTDQHKEYGLSDASLESTLSPEEDFEATIEDHPPQERVVLRQHKMEELRRMIHQRFQARNNGARDLVQTGLLQDKLLAMTAKQQLDLQMIEDERLAIQVNRQKQQQQQPLATTSHSTAAFPSALSATTSGIPPQQQYPHPVVQQDDPSYAQWYYAEYLPRLMYQQQRPPAAAAAAVVQLPTSQRSHPLYQHDQGKKVYPSTTAREGGAAARV